MWRVQLEARARGRDMEVSYITGDLAHGAVIKAPAAIVQGLELDEPVFVLRARDAVTLGLVELYRAQHLAFGDDRMVQLDDQIETIRAWRRAHTIRDAD